VAEEGWLVDFEKAKAQAAKEGKPILMEFTGSDWCPPCKALHKNVLVKDIFKEEMPKHYILLKLDNPRDKSKQTDAEKAQYKELAREYKVTGVPSVFLADAEGKPFFKNSGYSGQSADEWVEQMVGKSRIPKALAKAKKAKGIERAKLLDTALTLMGSKFANESHGEKIDEIIKLDAKNKAGLKVKYEGARKAVAFKDSLTQIMSDNRGAKTEVLIAKVDALVKMEKATGESLQQALFMQSSIMFQAKKKDEAEKLLIKAQKAAPKSDTAKRIDGILKQYFGKKNSL
ncbi:MAG: thioredoxin family protein, partial [Verrucomicrobiia bacterium]